MDASALKRVLIPGQIKTAGHEVKKRRVVVVEGADVVGIDEAAGRAGEVDGGDTVAGVLEQAEEPEPAPGAMAGAVHKDEVLRAPATLGKIVACG
uniref:Uncharacterized protein n=1 Tax=Oryza meridionalis TaxID=40149 RepID=A0A0E0F1Y2_9ORYZ